MEEIVYWTKMALSRWRDFEGRSRRREYWYFYLAGQIVILIAMLMRSILTNFPGEWLGQLLLLAIGIVLVIPSLAVAVRRLHDTGKSGLWLLLSLIPLIGTIVILIFLVQDSRPGSNKWGANPKGC